MRSQLNAARLRQHLFDTRNRHATETTKLRTVADWLDTFKDLNTDIAAALLRKFADNRDGVVVKPQSYA